jgi:hypothetical protein
MGSPTRTPATAASRRNAVFPVARSIDRPRAIPYGLRARIFALAALYKFVTHMSEESWLQRTIGNR